MIFHFLKFQRVIGIVALLSSVTCVAWAGLPPAKRPPLSLSRRLDLIRTKMITMEQDLISGVRTQKEAKGNLQKIESLLHLQHQEKALGQQRMNQLETTIEELEERRAILHERSLTQQKEMHHFLTEIHGSSQEDPSTFHLPEKEKLEAPRRKVLAGLVNRGIKELEALKADLADADILEAKIQEEKQQLAYVFQDLKEQEGVLELNRQLQQDLVRRKSAEHLSQLENYHSLKSAEVEVEKLIQTFNARMELEHNIETERLVSRAFVEGEFPKNRGKLHLPVKGTILSAFGRAFDPKSKLFIFKKGIDIEAGKKEPVQAIFAGKVAYSGLLPNYGRVVIVDHGDHFYSLCANLGVLFKRAGDAVTLGDKIGLSDDAGTPVYFEIRSRNVAVNPLQWVTN